MLSFKKACMVLGVIFMNINPLMSAEILDNRLYVVIKDKSESDAQVQGINQTVRDLGQSVGMDALDQFSYADAQGLVYPYISAFPFIIMKGKEGPMATLSQQDNIQTVSVPGVVAAFGPSVTLQPFTKKFSVYKPTVPIINPLNLSGLESFLEEGTASFALLDQELESGKALNALAHMSVGAGSAFQHKFSPTFDVVGTLPQDRLSLINGALSDASLTVVRFLDTMHLGPTYREQIAATLTRTPRVTGLYAIGPAAVLKKALMLLK